jgi:hypothetical protein
MPFRAHACKENFIDANYSTRPGESFAHTCTSTVILYNPSEVQHLTRTTLTIAKHTQLYNKRKKFWQINHISNWQVPRAERAGSAPRIVFLAETKSLFCGVPPPKKNQAVPKRKATRVQHNLRHREEFPFSRRGVRILPQGFCSALKNSNYINIVIVRPSLRQCQCQCHVKFSLCACVNHSR